MSKFDTNLWKEIKSELHEDVGNYGVSSLEDLESWSETCLDCPSNTLMDLMDKIPSDQQEKFDDLINEEINNIVIMVTNELGEDGEFE